MSDETPTTESFADYPITLGEAKKSSAAHDWTPRDALISVLRAIDKGEINPDCLIICYRELDAPGFVKSNFRSVSPDIHATLGLLSFTSMRLTMETQE